MLDWQTLPVTLLVRDLLLFMQFVTKQQQLIATK